MVIIIELFEGRGGVNIRYMLQRQKQGGGGGGGVPYLVIHAIKIPIEMFMLSNKSLLV